MDKEEQYQHELKESETYEYDSELDSKLENDLEFWSYAYDRPTVIAAIVCLTKIKG